jgi:NAD-dependent deacetylase
MKNVVVLTGAGMSAESGIKTFRDADGLWEGYDVLEVASSEGFQNNPELVLNFYNQRRKQLLKVHPNSAHYELAKLQSKFNVSIITQNVDDLHERAGSTKIIHLHGELLKVRSSIDSSLVYDWTQELHIGDLCEKKSQLRPHIVWFGEAVPLLDQAISLTSIADILIIIGTSMQVYPAASLVNYIKTSIPIFFIDPKPSIPPNAFDSLTIIPETATIGVSVLIKEYLNG